MKKSTIGGFVIRELPASQTKKDNIAKCWGCGKYSKQSNMQVINKKHYCNSCK